LPHHPANYHAEWNLQIVEKKIKEEIIKKIRYLLTKNTIWLMTKEFIKPELGSYIWCSKYYYHKHGDLC
jgi:hypothetical protein